MSNLKSKCDSRVVLPRLKPLSLHPLSHAILCALYGLAPLPALALDSNALPTNGQVIAGSGSISSNGNVMTVNQGSDRLIATWNTFNIGSGAQVNFQQPGSSSIALNRVTGSDGSQILGHLNANGQVFLINPSGVLFGAGSVVNVGGLVASSLDISNSDFLAGKNLFSGVSKGAVINQGRITAADGGSVALLGAQVRNEGTVVARLGSVMLGGGEKITLDFNGDGLINMEVNDPAIGASVVNRGLLQANGGAVAMSASASQALLSNVVNNEGVIEARSVQQRNGRIVLDGGSSGVVVNSGTLDASGRNAGERGGNVTMTGEYVGLFDNGRIDASGDQGGGTVLMGGDYQGSGSLHQASATFMGSDARVSADALTNGDGGKVILWSLDNTQFYGGIGVHGAGANGRGGLVETSGHNLDVTGIVDLSAVSGKGGTWLIDPYNINITAGPSSGATNTSPFTSSGASSSNLSSATLNASLSEGANILVCTTSVGGTSGDINVLDNVRAVGNATLTLQAHRNIVMTNTSISNATGKSLNVALYSNYNNTGNGSVALSNATISTNGGNLTVSGAIQPQQSWASTNISNGVGISLSNGTVITTNGGSVSLRGATSSTLAAGSTATAINISGGSRIDAGGGDINIVALQGSTRGTGDAFILTGGSSLLTAGPGSITVDATNLGSGNGTRIFSTNNTIAATGSGNVTLRGNATSGFGVLICSTAATSSQNISVGNGTLTVQGNGNGFAGSGRGVFLAASGSGSVNLSGGQGGDIVLDGSSSGTFGTVLNSSGATSSINLKTDGDISLTGRSNGLSDSAVSLTGSNLVDGGNGGNIRIVAQQTNTNSAGDALILSGGGTLRTAGTGSIDLDSTNLGSGNGTRIFSTNNTIAATGSGNVTLRGNATSGFGVLICSTAANSSQNVSVGSGTLTVQGNGNGFAGSGRGVYLAASGSGSVNLNSDQNGDIVLDGSSTGSYGTILNATGATSSINLNTDGDITLSGVTAGGSTPALALVASGDGTAATPGSTINLHSNAGNISLKANHNTVSTASGSFKALSLDAGGAYSQINLGTASGNLTLDGTSTSGRGVDIAPSGAGAQINLTTTSGDINISGNSTRAFGGYGIFFNSTGNAQGVNVSTQTGDITLRGDSVGTSDAIALGGSTGNGTSSNRITSQGGNITLNGNFHSPNSDELDHGIAVLSVNNVIQTTGNGNVTLIGNASDAGSGVEVYGNGKALFSVENGALSITGTSGLGDGIGLLTGQNVIQATGTGSVSLTGQSDAGSGINIYPSGNSSSLTVSTVSGDLTLNGTSGPGSSEAGLSIRSGGSGASNGVKIGSASGNVALTGTALGSGDGVAFSASNASGFNSVSTGANGNLTLKGTSRTGAALSFDDGNNTLQVQDGLLLLDLRNPSGHYITHTDDSSTLSASGSGAVVISRDGIIEPGILDASTSLTRQFQQMQMAYGIWSRPLSPDYHLTPAGDPADKVQIDVAQLRGADGLAGAASRSSFNTDRE